MEDKSHSQTQYNHAAIRRFLVEVFTTDELSNFCFDHFLDFHETHGDLKRNEKARQLVEYCLRKGKLNDLMSALEREQPEPFRQQRDQMIKTPVVPLVAPPADLVVTPQPLPNPLFTAEAPSSSTTNTPFIAHRPFITRLRNQIRPVHLTIPGGIIVLVLVVWGAISLIATLSDATETPAATATNNALSSVSTTTPSMPAYPQPSQTSTSTPSRTPTAINTATSTSTPTSTATPMLALGATWVRPKDDMVMVYVPPGTFTMGSNESDLTANSDEFPAHEVTLTKGFWIDRTEVTNEQYGRCVNDNNCNPSIFADNANLNLHNQPVVGVSWEDANDYCTWVGGRLLTEAEWEYAARGGDGRIYPWTGDFDGSALNFCDTNCSFDWKDTNWDDGYAGTAPVGNYPAGASWVGALDMVGNVWEWVNDWYEANYYNNSTAINPAGPAISDFKVLRGGSWYLVASVMRATTRHSQPPTYRLDSIGFRCAAEAND